MAMLEHELTSAEKENKKLSQIAKEYERDMKSLAKSEKEFKKQFQKIEADFKAIDKKYTKSKKYARELEDRLMEKEDKIKQMQLQKKNDDLVSQIESTAGLGNELGELEFLQMDLPATTRAGGTKNLISQADVDDLEPDNEDDEYAEDATLDGEKGRKNSLLQMENDFQFQNNFEDQQY